MGEENQNMDEELKIVVRKNEYHVSKKFICSSVPYFEKMFCCDLLESKENKVTLDFDENVFNSILNWIHSGLLIIQMKNVINCYDLADYLMIDEHLFGPCLSYFHENFTIEHLPVILPQVTKVSKLMNSEVINYFICRHFLKIANTNIFLDYPVETIEHILKLDLMIYSEYQVFESIMKWVNTKVDSRIGLLPRLLKCMRWSFMDPIDITRIKDNELIKTLPDLDSIIFSNCEYVLNRSKQNFFISIHRIDNSSLRISVFDKDLFCLPIGDFTKDDSISLEFVHGEQISDILFDCGAKGIRIDWMKKSFKWFDFKVAGETHYSRLYKMIVPFFKQNIYLTCHLEEKDYTPVFPIAYDEYVFLESNDKYIVIGKTKDTKMWFGLFPVLDRSWFNLYEDHKRTFHATVLDKVVYIFTKDLEFIQFNYETRSFDKCLCNFGREKWNFNDLILTSHQSKDDKIILINNLSGKIHFYLINQQKWIQKHKIMNINFCSNNSNAHSNQLIAFTSTFIQMKNIKPLYKRNFRSL